VEVAVAVAVAVGVVVAVGVAVGVGDGQVVMILRIQPASTKPKSEPTASSRTYRLHVPLGSVPLKIESAEPPKGVGAGGGQVSPAP
jgi:hypothetical protein